MKPYQEITIRDATAADIPIMASLMEHLGYRTTDREMKIRFDNISSRGDFRTLLADCNQVTVGLAGLSKNFSYELNGIFIRVLALIVAPEYQSSGIGWKLMKAAEDWATETGANRMVLTCGNRDDRKKAHEFYLNLGFEIRSTGFVKIIQAP
jgi:GNAT superfamily N-acetyltransferase